MENKLKLIRVEIAESDEADEYFKLSCTMNFGGETRHYQQHFHRSTLEDHFESHFNVLFDLVRRRMLAFYAKATGKKVQEPFYGVTFGAGENRDSKGVLLPDKD